MRSEGGYVRPAVRRLLIDVLLAGGAALVAVLFDMFGPDYRGVGGLLWDLALAAPLALRRSAPATAAILVGAVCLAQWLTGGPVLGDLAVLIMVYSLAAWDRRRWLVAAALLVAGVGAVMAVERWGGREGEWLSALMMMGTVTAAAAIGLYVRTRRAYLASVIERAENAERDRDRQARIAVAEERARLAREMHDVVAHSLAVMITLNDAVVAVTPTGTVRDTAAQASDVGRQALGEMQRMLAVFRGAEPVDLVPQPGAAQLGDLIASVRSAGLPVDLTISGTAAELSPTTQLAIYRIVQESLTNVLKHARNVGRVLVTITYRTDRVQVRIRNDGEPVAARNGSPLGHGLVGMRQRSALYEGQFRAGPIPGGGWEVLADLSLLTPGLVQ